MKNIKLRFVIFAIVLICLIFYPAKSSDKFESYFDRAEYHIFAKHDFISNFSTSTRCGNSYIISCNICDAKKLKDNITEFLGESVRIKDYTNSQLKNLKTNFEKKKVFEETIDNMQIIYCYDRALTNFVFVDGKKVNIQIAISTNEINIGYPLILNGY